MSICVSVCEERFQHSHHICIGRLTLWSQFSPPNSFCMESYFFLAFAILFQAIIAVSAVGKVSDLGTGCVEERGSSYFGSLWIISRKQQWGLSFFPPFCFATRAEITRMCVLFLWHTHKQTICATHSTLVKYPHPPLPEDRCLHVVCNSQEEFLCVCESCWLDPNGSWKEIVCEDC